MRGSVPMVLFTAAVDNNTDFTSNFAWYVPAFPGLKASYDSVCSSMFFLGHVGASIHYELHFEHRDSRC